MTEDTQPLGLWYYDCQHWAWQLTGTLAAPGPEKSGAQLCPSFLWSLPDHSLVCFSLLTLLPSAFLYVTSPAHSPEDEEKPAFYSQRRAVSINFMQIEVCFYTNPKLSLSYLAGTPLLPG